MRQFIPCFNGEAINSIKILINKKHLDCMDVGYIMNNGKTTFFVVGEFSCKDYSIRMSSHFDNEGDAINKMYEIEAEFFG